MKFLIYIFLFFCAKNSFAQQSVNDTIWYDSDWKEISKKYANFYRLIENRSGMFLVKDFYSNGEPQMTACASQVWPLVKNGTCEYYYKKNVRSSKGDYKNNEKSGIWIFYFDNGKDSSVVNFISGDTKEYIRKSKHEDVYNIVEVMPEFPGGMNKMIDFIQTNLKYPKEAQKKGWEGKTFFKFIVDSTGKVIDPIVLKTSGYDVLDNEGLRVISMMPNWEPGTQGNRKVSVYFNVPLNFTLGKKRHK